MNNYTSRQIAPKLFREDTGITCATRAKDGEKEKDWKKVKFIINNDSITGIDIHSKIDLKIADYVIKYLKKNKISYF